MKSVVFSVGLTILLVGEISAAQAQAPKPTPAAVAEEKSRFSPELIELFTAISGGYEVNGKANAPAMDTAIILRATQSKDPRVQEIGRMACGLVYMHGLLRKQKLDPEIARAARAAGADVPAKPKEIIDAMLSRTEKDVFKEKARFAELVAEAAKDRDGKLEPSETRELLEKGLFTKPQQAANRTTALRIVGQVKVLAMKERMRAMVGEPTNPLPALKEPIGVKLVTTKEKAVVVAFTNQAKVPLRNCLVFTQAVNDPIKVEKKTNMEMTTRLLLPDVVGASQENLKSAKTGIQLESILLNLDRGSVVFVPEIPAGATVRVGLTSVKDMSYVKHTELSLWCDELTIESLSAGTSAGFPPELAGTPIQCDKNGAASMQLGLAKGDPRDPKSPPGRTKVCKVYTLPMTAGKTFIIEAVGDRRAPVLRVEDASGELQTTTKEKTRTNTFRIAFTPATDGEYRIVCTEGFGGPGEFTLKVRMK